MKSRRLGKRSQQSGQAIVLIALGMIALMAFIVLGIDGGKYLDQRRVAQNASDAAATAGMYKYWSGTGTTYDNTVLAEINRVAEINGIPDDSAPADNDAVNSHVEAYWIQTKTSGGTTTAYYVPDTAASGCSGASTTQTTDTEPPLACALLQNSGTLTKPSSATGIKVRSRIPYTTFIGQMVGQRNLTAQADSIALLSMTWKNLPDDPYSVWLGGSKCNTLSHAAFVFGQGGVFEHPDFVNGMFVNGAGAIENSHNTTIEGNFVIRTMAGNDEVDAHALPNNNSSDPWLTSAQGGVTYSGTTNGVANQYYAPGNLPPGMTAYPSGDMPAWAYITLNGVKSELDASSFIPADVAHGGVAGGSGAGGPYYQLYDKYQKMGLLDKEYQTWSGTTNPAPAANVWFHYAANQAALSFTGEGIYYVAGPIVSMGSTPSNVTLVTSSTFDGSGNNNASYGDAGPLGMNITILAGAHPSFPQSCANDHTNAVLSIDEQQFKWSGILYVPYGQLSLNGNFHASDHNGPLVAYSFNAGYSHPANSAGFNFKAILTQPFPSGNLSH